MGYKEDNLKWQERCKETQRLYNIYHNTQKEEDRVAWWNSSVVSKKYLTLQIKIWPGDEVNAEQIKELLESGSCNLPWKDGLLFDKDGKVLAEVIEARASVWPKPCISPES